MSLLLPRISFAPGRCGPAVRQHEISPFFSLLDDAFAEVQRASRHSQPQKTARAATTTQHKEWTPRFDVKETADAYYVDAELPGVDPQDVSVEFVDENILSIKGRSERHTERGTRPEYRSLVEDNPASAQEAGSTAAATPSGAESDTGSVKSYQATVEDEDATGAPVPPSGESFNSESAEQPAAATDAAAAETGPNNQVQARATEAEESRQEQYYWFSERHIGTFQRQFAFPTRVDQDRIKASLKNGLLSITVPKARAPESRRINIE